MPREYLNLKWVINPTTKAGSSALLSMIIDFLYIFIFFLLIFTFSVSLSVVKKGLSHHLYPRSLSLFRPPFVVCKVGVVSGGAGRSPSAELGPHSHLILSVSRSLSPTSHFLFSCVGVADCLVV